MDIKPDRMISLGYGKFWRSDAIVGLMPIEQERGPGRRTEVYTASLDGPLVASRSHQAILQDLAVASDDALRMQEVREMLSDLIDALDDVPDVLRRMLHSEARFDVQAWSRRLQLILTHDPTDSLTEQNELFD